MSKGVIAATVEALSAWLDSAVNHELRGDFSAIRPDRIRAFLPLIPPPPAPCIVAGTKGKGSTVRLIEAALVAQGLPTVAFTSPHVVSVRERWRSDGRETPLAAVVQAAERIAHWEGAHGIALTWFERGFVIACLLASARPGTYFLLEVGLGGRLDCANALDASVAVLTHLSHDHREVLGPTLGHIAREKLAIARSGRPLVLAPQSRAADAAIATVLAEYPAADRPTLHRVSAASSPFSLAMAGAHQQDNAATALMAARLLVPHLDEKKARAGMATATLPARCQLVEWQGRRLLIDGAHNGPSVAATMAVAQRVLRPGWSLALGLAREKEIDEILAVIPVGMAAHRVGYDALRARGEADWPPATRPWPWWPRISDLLSSLPPGTDLCVTGSFYLAGEALRLVTPPE